MKVQLHDSPRVLRAAADDALPCAKGDTGMPRSQGLPRVVGHGPLEIQQRDHVRAIVMDCYRRGAADTADSTTNEQQRQ